MARELLLALACACAVAAAAAARYGDYAAVKMPQYGDYDAPAAASDDYRDHSPDAPASLDYKYEEHSDKIEKTLTNDVEEEDAWNKPPKKIRKHKSVNDGDQVALNKYKLDEVAPKFKTNYRNKNRDRYRSKSKVTAEEFPNRRLNPDHSTEEENQKLEFDDEDSEVHPEDFQEDNKSIEHEKSKFVRREIRKKSRRKPRDRPIIDTRMKADAGSEDEESILSDVRDIQKTLKGKESVYPDVEERPWVPLSPGLGVRAKPRVRAHGEDDEDVPRVVLPPPKAPQPPPNLNAYSEYADYYDMQRVQNIKNKLPPLLHRTKARVMEPTTTETYSSSWQPRKIFNRRKDIQPENTANFFEEITTTSTRITTTTAPETRPQVSTTPYTTTSTVTPVPIAANVPLEMSLAEKSRLSILRKSQKKESFREDSRTKPPVLLQVAERMHTVVMVEPKKADDPWIKAYTNDEDSPEIIAQVKRIMKRKLIANAKSVRDLTDNWDDVICEYVDISQLKTVVSAAVSVFTRHMSKYGNPVFLVLSALCLNFLI
ncbi:uncharacterized protein [Choristoneura fumiferana]|uniref:uncharacterized protein n=1 Tax=Choristoneura fumiferana TaxID=7141 RepID=UPI003D15BEBD